MSNVLEAGGLCRKGLHAWVPENIKERPGGRAYLERTGV